MNLLYNYDAWSFYGTAFDGAGLFLLFAAGLPEFAAAAGVFGFGLGIWVLFGGAAVEVRKIWSNEGYG